MATPKFLPEPEGLRVQIETNQKVPVSEWTSHPDIPNWMSAFLRLRDDGLAIEKDDGYALLLHWTGVANLNVDQLEYMGLPDACPYTLEITSDQSILDTNFDVQYGFVWKGRRVLGCKREGAWLSAGNDQFILVNPLYEIIESIDQFGFADNQGLEGRMLQWGHISEQLPDDALVPDRLNSIKITVASSFKLNPFSNASGEPDFNPVVGQWKISSSEGEEEKREFASTLPSARQTDFAKRFRRLSSVKHRYAVGGSSYVVLTEQVEKALAVVHDAQRSSPEERHEFLQNVSGYLRGSLDQAGGTDIEVNDVFCDDGLSERVKGIGAWVEPVLPWIVRSSEPWLPPKEVGLQVGARILQLPPKELPKLLAKVESAIHNGVKTVVTSEGEEIPAHSETVSGIKELIRRLPSLRESSDTDKPETESHLPESEASAKQVLLVIDNLEDILFRRERRECEPGISGVAPALQSTLLPHQEEALEWLLQHWEAGNWGALLADDMGLGKTLEALAFLSCLQTHMRTQGIRHRPMLVVAPTGLLRNWQDEHEKHMSGDGLGLPIQAHGTRLKRLKIPASSDGNELGYKIPLPKLDIDTLKRAAWVLTTYETLRDYQHSFGRIQWSAAVFDEAQKIKNPGAQVSVAALAMKIDFALLMTGTPVENRPADIWSLLERVEPGMFGTLDQFSRKHETGTSQSSSELDKLNQALTKSNGAPQLMLRRLKEDHLSGLPEKEVHLLNVDMPGAQAKAYEQAVDYARMGGEGILQTIHRIRMISLHPEVPDEDWSDEEYIQRSARLSETFAILQEIADLGEKALVFLESLQMQGFLIGALRRKFQLPDDVLVINGSVPGDTRKARVDIFQNRQGFDVMLLSPRAGGVGLTLTAANHVIHLSRWWNPAVEDQCTDRVFRIGQERDVHVYFPMAIHPQFGTDSFDWKLNDLITRKRETNRRILSPINVSEGDKKDLYKSIIGEMSKNKSVPPQ